MINEPNNTIELLQALYPTYKEQSLSVFTQLDDLKYDSPDFYINAIKEENLANFLQKNKAFSF